MGLFLYSLALTAAWLLDVPINIQTIAIAAVVPTISELNGIKNAIREIKSSNK